MSSPDLSYELCEETGGEGPLTFQELSSSHLHPNQQAQLPEGELRQSLEFLPHTFLPIRMPLSPLWATPNFCECPQLHPLSNVQAGRGDKVSPVKGSATWSLESCP